MQPVAPVTNTFLFHLLVPALVSTDRPLELRTHFRMVPTRDFYLIKVAITQIEQWAPLSSVHP